MPYTPKTEEDLIKESLYPDGDYDFEVIGTQDTVSKSGNDMYVLKLKVFNDDDYTLLTDYIAFGSNFGERKFRHAADTCGLLDVYSTGNLKADDFLKKCGKVKIKIQEGSAQYPNPKNVVVDYIKHDSVVTAASPKVEDDLNDGIPF